MNIIKTIAKQEIAKVFKNKKMLSSIFVLPFIMLVAMFAMTSMGETEEAPSTYQVHFINMPVAEQTTSIGEIGINIVPAAATSYEEFATGNSIQKNDIVVELTEKGFQIYYNSLYSATKNLIPIIESNILRPFAESMFLAQQEVVKEPFHVTSQDTSSEQERKNRTLSLLLPYLMIIILFMNLVSVVGDSIAGEKERGTLIKQVLAPIENREMILGKLLGTTVIGVISSFVFFVILIGGSYVTYQLGSIDMLGMKDGSMTFSQISIMFLGFLFIAMVFVAAIALMSSFAKTIKEATNMSLVIYYLVLFAALATGFTVGEIPRVAFLIPVYNFSLFMHELLTGTAEAVNGMITVISLMITFGILAGIAILNFRREKVIC